MIDFNEGIHRHKAAADAERAAGAERIEHRAQMLRAAADTAADGLASTARYVATKRPPTTLVDVPYRTPRKPTFWTSRPRTHYRVTTPAGGVIRDNAMLQWDGNIFDLRSETTT